MIEKGDIEKLVLSKKKSTLKTHFFDAFNYNTIKYSGEVRQHEILLWSSSYWLRSLYPIFLLEFDEKNHLNGISIEPNPLEKVSIYIAFIGVLLFASTPLFGYGFQKGLPLTILIVIVGFLLFLILRRIKREETKIMTVELRESIEKIEREKFPEKFAGWVKKEIPKEKEWTIKKILTRIIFYPFSLFIIYLSLTGLIPQGKIGKGIFGILICSAYLYSDLYSIFKKQDKT